MGRTLIGWSRFPTSSTRRAYRTCRDETDSFQARAGRGDSGAPRHQLAAHCPRRIFFTKNFIWSFRAIAN